MFAFIIGIASLGAFLNRLPASQTMFHVPALIAPAWVTCVRLALSQEDVGSIISPVFLTGQCLFWRHPPHFLPHRCNVWTLCFLVSREAVISLTM